MNKQISPLSPAQHRDIYIRSNDNFLQASEDQLIPLVVQEVVDAATEFPVLFVKNSSTGEFTLVAMLGLKAQQNLYCSDESDQQYDANYAPLVLRNYPFYLQQSAEQQFAVCIDELSPLVNHDEGQKLFNDNDEQTDFLKNKAESLIKFVEQQHITKGFIQLLLEHDLLHPQKLTIRLNDNDPLTIDGIYMVDQQRLENLDDEVYSTLRKNGALQIIHAHLMSMKQVNRLTRRLLTSANK